MREPDKKQIKPALVSGLFYPEEEEALRERLETEAAPYPEGSAGLLLAPHGSYDKIGPCLGAAYAAARKRPVRKVLLLGPVHREKEPFFSLPEKAWLATPLGPLPVPRNPAEKLCGSTPLFRRDDTPHMEEHCLEVHLPFIKQFWPEAEVLPILTGKLNRREIRRAAEALEKLGLHGEEWLTVLSVNLSGCLPPEEARRDADRLEDLLRFPLPCSLAEEEKRGTLSSCGTVPLTLASELFPAKGAPRPLEKGQALFSDHQGEKGVFYGAFSWE